MLQRGTRRPLHARRLGLRRAASSRRRTARPPRPATATSTPTSSPTAICGARELGRGGGRRDRRPTALLPWSRWITPEQVPIRFDTRFYVALAPAALQAASPTASRWTRPAGSAPASALDEHGRGRASSSPSRRSSTSRSCAATPTPTPCSRRPPRRPVVPLTPKVVGTEDSFDDLLPGEPGYDELSLDRRRPAPGRAPARRTRGRSGRCAWPCSSSSDADPAEELAGVVEGQLELVAGQLPQPPEEVELAVGGAEVDLAVDRRRPVEEARAEELAQGDRVVALGDGRDEAPVELDALELDPQRGCACGAARPGVASIDSTSKAGTTRRQVGHVGLGEDRPGQDAPSRRSPPSSRSSASQLAPQKPGASSPVSRFDPPGQSAAGASRALIPPTSS